MIPYVLFIFIILSYCIYRKKYGFKARQPLCARALSERRSKSGKKRGLPENLRKSIAQRSSKKKK